MVSGAHWPELVRPERRRGFPMVIAGQVDMLPAERRQMGEITGLRVMPLLSKVIDRPLKVGRIP